MHESVRPLPGEAGKSHGKPRFSTRGWSNRAGKVVSLKASSISQSTLSRSPRRQLLNLQIQLTQSALLAQAAVATAPGERGAKQLCYVFDGLLRAVRLYSNETRNAIERVKQKVWSYTSAQSIQPQLQLAALL